MKYELYEDLHTKDNFSVFEFISIGEQGHIPKRIAFFPTDYSTIYNLVFGDIDVNGEIDDYSVSNNGDRNKILATIVHVIEIYLRAYPERYVFFTGSTDARIRLYRMVVCLNLEELQSKFHIFAKVDNIIIPFQKNTYLEGFLISIKH